MRGKVITQQKFEVNFYAKPKMCQRFRRVYSTDESQDVVENHQWAIANLRDQVTIFIHECQQGELLSSRRISDVTQKQSRGIMKM